MPKSNLPYRKSIRLKGWDYRNPGLYFITICTKNRIHHFGEINNGIMGLSVPGCLAHYYWRQIPDHHPNVALDEFIVMPNHLHGIVGIESVGSSMYRDPNTDAMNHVPTDEDYITDDNHTIVPVGPSIHGGRKTGGATWEHNPMLYDNHLGKIIRRYKGRCTYEIRKRDYSDFAWQSRFYDHIIRNEESLNRIREYIATNPLRWHLDRENPNWVHEMAVKYMEHT